MNWRRFLLVATAALWSGAGVADDAYRQCIDTTVRNDEWARCGGDWVKREEARMRSLLQEILAKSEQEVKATLVEEQGKWDTYRASACQIYDSSMGREGQVLGYPSCVAELVSTRSLMLQRYLDALDGNP